MAREYINTSVSLRLDQVNFVNEQSKQFNLSKYFRDCLDDYIKLFNKKIEVEDDKNVR